MTAVPSYSRGSRPPVSQGRGGSKGLVWKEAPLPERLRTAPLGKRAQAPLSRRAHELAGEGGGCSAGRCNQLAPLQLLLADLKGETYCTRYMQCATEHSAAIELTEMPVPCGVSTESRRPPSSWMTKSCVRVASRNTVTSDLALQAGRYSSYHGAGPRQLNHLDT